MKKIFSFNDIFVTLQENEELRTGRIVSLLVKERLGNI